MSLLTAFVVAVVLPVGIAGLTFAVYRDSERLGMGKPALWAGIVCCSTAIGLGLVVITEIPPPGIIVVAVIGPVIYLFERDDALHDDDDEPTDAFTLPEASDSDAESSDESGEDT